MLSTALLLLAQLPVAPDLPVVPTNPGELVVYAPRDRGGERGVVWRESPTPPVRPATPPVRPLIVPQGNPRPQLLRRVVPVAQVVPRPVYVPSRVTYAVPVVRVPVYGVPAYAVGSCANGQCAAPQQGFRLFRRR